MVVFDTHLKIDMLENVHIAALDIFKKTVYHKIIEGVQKDKEDILQNSTLFNDLHMWLSLLCTETVEDAIKLITVFPPLNANFENMKKRTCYLKTIINNYLQ